MGIDYGQLFTEAQPRTQQRFQLSGCLEHVESSDRAQHALMHLALLAKALDDLQVSIRASAFDAEIHRAVLFLYSYPTLASRAQSKAAECPQNLTLHFGCAPARDASSLRFPQTSSPDALRSVERESRIPGTQNSPQQFARSRRIIWRVRKPQKFLPVRS